MGFYEFHITLANQKTGETEEIKKEVSYSKAYNEAWQIVTALAYEKLEAKGDYYWYIAKIENYI